MNNVEVKELVEKVFNLIYHAKNFEDLENIIDDNIVLQNNKKEIDVYPRIEFSISDNDIKYLINERVLDDNHNISIDYMRNNINPLNKLLYSIIWKQGDLLKLNHIVKGINYNSGDIIEDGIVFNQFGKYLANRDIEPIIDQHVIRAFGCKKYPINDPKFCNFRKMAALNKSHLADIECYKILVKSGDINPEINPKDKEFLYFVDNVLFALGKAIKLKKQEQCT